MSRTAGVTNGSPPGALKSGAVPGDIQVTGASGNGQIVQLSIRGASGETSELAPLTPSATASEGWPDNSVARPYALVARVIRAGTRSAPSFRDAVALQETVDAIERSAARTEPNDGL